MPTAAIAVRVLDHMELVDKVAAQSKNLHGRFARALRVAAQETRIAETELATRSATSSSAGLEAENRALQKRVEDLEADLRQLRKKMETRRRAPMGGSDTVPVVVPAPVSQVAGTSPLPPSPGPQSPKTPSSLGGQRGPSGPQPTTARGRDPAYIQRQEDPVVRITQLIDQRFAALRAEMLPLMSALEEPRRPPPAPPAVGLPPPKPT
nr:PREDICTED: myb-related transcription factor, partner of profilin-like [Megachile rotundata]